MVIQTLTIDNISWTPVVSSINCNYLGIKVNGNSVKIRSNVSDANTEDTIDPGTQEIIIGTPVLQPGYKPRFTADQNTGYFLQLATVGVGAIKLRFLE